MSKVWGYWYFFLASQFMNEGKWSLTYFLLKIRLIIWQQKSLILILFRVWVSIFLFSWIILKIYEVVDLYANFSSSKVFYVIANLYPLSKFFIGISFKTVATSLYVSSNSICVFIISSFNLLTFFLYSTVFVHCKNLF